jgi:hypothetical protein
LRGLDGIMGPIGHAAYPRGDATWVMPPVRKKFNLFAAVRPSLSHGGIPSIHTVVDIVFLRELGVRPQAQEVSASLRRQRRGAARPCVPWPHPAKRAHRCRGCGPAD